MARRFTLVCEDTLARDVERLARENDITEEEVLRQLIGIGMENLERQ